MPVSEQMHFWLLPNTGLWGRNLASPQEIFLFSSYSSAFFSPTGLLVLWVMSIKSKINSCNWSKETQNRVMPDLVSKEKNLFMICQNSALVRPTHVCRQKAWWEERKEQGNGLPGETWWLQRWRENRGLLVKKQTAEMVWPNFLLKKTLELHSMYGCAQCSWHLAVGTLLVGSK